MQESYLVRVRRVGPHPHAVKEEGYLVDLGKKGTYIGTALETKFDAKVLCLNFEPSSHIESSISLSTWITRGSHIHYLKGTKRQGAQPNGCPREH